MQRLLPTLLEANVALIEQPLPPACDAQLEGLHLPIKIAADESVQDTFDLTGMASRFDVVNIKLDKCGGLTEALAMARVCRDQGLEVMVGNMTGTSLAMAPSFVLGQLCSVVDLDGPIFLKSDRIVPVVYEQGMIWSPASLWGGPV